MMHQWIPRQLIESGPSSGSALTKRTAALILRSTSARCAFAWSSMVTPHQVLSGSLRPRAQRSRFIMSKFATVCAASTIALVYSNAYPGNFVTGASSNANFTLNTAANWQTIRSARTTIPATDAAIHDRVATVRADVLNPGLQGRENQYLFALTLNNSNPPVDNNTNTPGASPTDRMVEVTDNGTVNEASMPISRKEIDDEKAPTLRYASLATNQIWKDQFTCASALH
jgi:hypothetical protein